MQGDTLTAAGLWCRQCGLPARVLGEAELGRAVHAATGREQGGDEHVCAPIGFETAQMRAAREPRASP
jgi:hypothetical protein